MTGEPKNAARVIDALRRGWPVRISDGDDALVLRAVETLPPDPAPGDILLSASRAVTLKLVNQLAAADAARPVRIAAPADWSAALVRAIADPTLDLATPLKGPFRTLPLPGGAAVAAMDLARHAGLLPGFVIGGGEWEAEASAADGAAYADAAGLVIAARARLPISTGAVAAAVEAEIVAFRGRADPADHVALIVGRRSDAVPLVRLHSECLTGDVLGSLKCDCGPQLHDALARMAGDAGGWGVLLYLRQEGRGIGLVNKLRAYMLQDQGFDTVDANTRLGFAIDTRDFGVAAAMLRLLGIGTVRLLTNNPEKVAGLAAAGVAVTERVPTMLAENPHNARYLATKRDRTGHQF